MTARLPAVSNLAAAGFVAVIAGVHFEQYVDSMSQIPTIGILFLLNAAGGAGLAVGLLQRDRLIRILAAVGAVALAITALVSILIALTGQLFGYREPTARLPIMIAIVAEAAALPALALMLARERAVGHA